MNTNERILAGIGNLKADTTIENCRILNVNTKEILRSDIAIKSGYIVGIGDVSELKGTDTHIVDVNERYISPGLIDGHVHFESSMVTLSQFSEAALKHGTTGIIIDPHEIANVLGKQGIELVLEEARTLPLNVFTAVSSCVPATVFETSGSEITPEDAKDLMDNENVVGLAEMMDYPDVLKGDEEKIAMINVALEKGLLVDGHCPGLRGNELGGYICAGISTDYESIEYEEALEKLRFGMKLMLREGSAAKSLNSFLPRLINDKISLENVFFVTDDNHPGDLIYGYMDSIVRRAIELGLSPLDAISMCTINTARHYRIDHMVGSISVGKKADFVILDNLEEFKIHSVFASGEPIRTNTGNTFNYPEYVFNTIKYKEITPKDLQFNCTPETVIPIKVIKVLPDKIVTKMVEKKMKTDCQGYPGIEKDVLSTAVIERHGKNGNIGNGFVTGFNLKSGAFGQSIAHDSHNVIVTGTNYSDMALCANTIRKLGGGIVIAQDGKILDCLPLPFAGLLSMWSVEKVNDKLENMYKTIKNMGCRLPSPFITHSFIALPVIPDIRLTDMGLFDVNKFELIDTVLKTE